MRRTYQINNVSVPLAADEEELKSAAAAKAGIAAADISGLTVIKKAVDARNKNNVHWVYAFTFATDAAIKTTDEVFLSAPPEKVPSLSLKSFPRLRPLVVGSGPAGMFAGLALAEAGLNPIIIERGEKVENRRRTVLTFWQKGVLNPASNVQFGEGGAGTFSDGKLMTGIKKDAFVRKVFAELTAAGAPAEINHIAKPHIGTDNLRAVVANIRKKITALGGEYRFNTVMTGLIVKDGRIIGIETECEGNKDEIAANKVILAIGHSARDTFEMLCRSGVVLEQKPFSVGFRIEHKQENINRGQYGKFAGDPRLPAADYKMAVHFNDGRSAYTFCMCPGGVVVGAASEEGKLATNGMSEFKRDGVNANSAVLAEIGKADLASDHPLAGIFLQRDIEEKAFRQGGGNYFAPCELVGNFLKDKPSSAFGDVMPTYLPGTVFGNIKDLFPAAVTATLKKAIVEMDNKLRGFAAFDAVITAPETRSSSPVRIVRGADRQSNIKGLYPCGEGSGYAGGITSSAADGLKTAFAAYAD